MRIHPRLALALALLVSLSLAVTALARPRAVVTPGSVTLDGVSRLTLERLVIVPRFLDKVERYDLELSLDEHRTNGDVIFLASQRVPLANAVVVNPGSNRDDAIIEIDWAPTAGVQEGSDIEACAQLIHVKPNGQERPVGVVGCAVLTPQGQ